MAPATGRDVGLRVSTRNTAIWRANSSGFAFSRVSRFFIFLLWVLEMDRIDFFLENWVGKF